MDSKKLVKLLEVIALMFLAGAINLAFPDNPGYSSMYYIPYLGASVLVSTVYGAGWGFISFGLSAIVVAGMLPGALYLIHEGWSPADYWKNLPGRSYLPASIGLLCIYLFGVIRTAALSRITELQKRMRDLVRENWLLKQKSEALVKVNAELDERVSRQQEAITSLHTQLRKLDTLDVIKALEVLLETVHIFTRAEKSSVWRYDDREKSLRLAASRGWEAGEHVQTIIPLDGTIEGWVYRNNSLFSARMLLQYDNLKNMDCGRNIITIPLNFEQRTWGVLNIQEMPFEKYNLYSERLLLIIASLAEHSIERAVAYESIIQKEEIDSRTGLPLFSQFYKMLEEETRRTGVQKGNFSIMLIEFTNFDHILSEYAIDGAKGLIREIVEQLQTISERKALGFHYKEDAQIALLIPGLDIDGISLFSLETLEKLNTGDWHIDGNQVLLEAVIGFSVFAGGGDTPDQLLEQAENLLEMQKV